MLHFSLQCLLNCESRYSRQNQKVGVLGPGTLLPGALICEYTGVLRRTTEVEGLLENNYIFDIDCLQTMEGLDGREVLDVFFVCWLKGTVLLDPLFCGGFSFWK